jgi:ABC-type amino acid transport system permease subunit
VVFIKPHTQRSKMGAKTSKTFSHFSLVVKSSSANQKLHTAKFHSSSNSFALTLVLTVLKGFCCLLFVAIFLQCSLEAAYLQIRLAPLSSVCTLYIHFLHNPPLLFQTFGRILICVHMYCMHHYDACMRSVILPFKHL